MFVRSGIVHLIAEAAADGAVSAMRHIVAYAETFKRVNGPRLC